MVAAMKMAHASDPAGQILKQVGDLSKIDVFANQILLGVYQRPDKTASGLYLADTTRDEDIHQGKVGLVLKVGPQAFEDDDRRKFLPEERVNPGDWVAMWVADGKKIVVNNQLCRVVTDEQIRLRIPAPDVVF